MNEGRTAISGKTRGRRNIGEVVSIRPTYLSMADAMKYMGCKRDMLCRLRDDGKVRCSKIGKMLYFCVQDMDRLFEANVVNEVAYRLSV